MMVPLSLTFATAVAALAVNEASADLTVYRYSPYLNANALHGLRLWVEGTIMHFTLLHNHHTRTSSYTRHLLCARALPCASAWCARVCTRCPMQHAFSEWLTAILPSGVVASLAGGATARLNCTPFLCMPPSRLCASACARLPATLLNFH
jgi:hypothetical protein